MTRGFAFAAVAALVICCPAALAQSHPPYMLSPLSNSYEVGTRYWYSVGKFDKTLFDGTGSLLLSKLTYDGIAHTGEVYVNIADPKNWLLKGTAGIGSFSGKKLRDQDFNLPLAEPYSSTDSDLKKSTLNYASIDFGYYPWRGERGKLGGFVGYHYLHEKLNAYGCTQTGGNSEICVPTIPSSVLGITQENMWHSLRVGVVGDVMLTPNLRLSAEAAYLPYVKLDGADWHWLRIGTDFNGPTPETGRGKGVQFEAILSYMVNEYFTIGVGGRYWRMSVPNGTAHFEQSTIDGGPQVEKFQTDRYGVFVQAGLKY